MSKPIISFFFGAGAEVSYGLPCGGEFALEIFRQPTKLDKESFKKELSNIDIRSVGGRWMPTGFDTKPVSSFGKPQYEGILISSLENKRREVSRFLDTFDEQAHSVKAEFNRIHSIDIDIVLNDLGIEIGDTFSHEVKLSDSLGTTTKLFDSKYFSALLSLFEKAGEDDSEHLVSLKSIAKTFIELLIGALSKDLVHSLNDNLFEKRPALDIFDDIGGVFSLDYSRIGLDGLSFVIGKGSSLKGKVSTDAAPYKKLDVFFLRILERLFSAIMDYQALVDSSYRYIYTPATDWGKFSKISVFLFTVRRYILSTLATQSTDLTKRTGYYDDLKAALTKFELGSVGTTNYNRLITERTATDVAYLNGSVDDFYDPFRNRIVKEEDRVFKVPLLFTQSGIKPLTSITMSRRYVEFYDRLAKSDVTVVVGFGFNKDDGHINGLFRSLIDEDDKTVVVLLYKPDVAGKKLDQISWSIQEKLRISQHKNLKILLIDDHREIEGENWIDYIINHYTETLRKVA